MEARTERIRKGARRFGSALAGVLVLGGWIAGLPALHAQDPGGDPGSVEEEEECVCLDLEKMNLAEHVDVERIRRRIRRSLQHVERARLGFEIRPSGVRVQTLGPELGEYFGTDRGALVLDVTEASTSGLRSGDVVLGVGERDVEDAGDFRRIVRSYERGEEISFRIRREGRETTITGAAP